LRLAPDTGGDLLQVYLKIRKTGRFWVERSLNRFYFAVPRVGRAKTSVIGRRVDVESHHVLLLG
jgi:hypothetical protein